MADIKINSLKSVSNQSTEIKQLTEQESQAIVGGTTAFATTSFSSLSAVNLQAAWCWCGGTILV